MTCLTQLLKEWGLEKSVREIRKNHVRYTYEVGSIDFIFLKEGDTFFKIHSELWCENKTEIFIVIFENEDILICDAKTKPTKEHLKENAAVDSFNYKRNTRKAKKYLHLFQKKNIDSGWCIHEMQKLLTKRKKTRITIEKDLITTMELCTKKIGRLLDKKDKKIAYKIIDQCLLIRFLEDKADRDNLKNVLENGNLNDLLNLFNSYEIFDEIFEKDIPKNINIMEMLKIFGPEGVYNFRRTPVMMISSIYEHLLSKRENNQGFMPENVAEYITDKILNNCPVNKIKENKIKILDFTCRSGVFLIKFLEKIIDIKEENGIPVPLEEKIQILKNLYGIDKSSSALQIAAFCLYLKIVEDKGPEVVNRFFNNRVELNIKQKDSVDNPFCEAFDIIVGNLLQVPFLHKRTVNEDTWSSDCSSRFLLRIKEWMEPKTVCGIIAPLSYFTGREYTMLRKDFLGTYGLKSFTNLSRITDITAQQNLCILFFGTTSNTVEFCTPELNYFSVLTGSLTEDNSINVAAGTLNQNDLWPVYARGYHPYLDVIDLLDDSICCFEDFMHGEHLVVREKGSRMYRALKSFEDQYPDSLSFPWVEEESEHLKNINNIKNSDLRGKKLFVTKKWPIKTFIASEVYDSTNFWVYELKCEYPAQYLLLFEAILNSKLATFYFAVKYNLGESSCHVDVQHLDHFPIPDLEHGRDIDELVEIALSLKSVDPGELHYKNLQDDRDNLVFALYDLDYYDIKEIEHYFVEKERSVTEEDIRKYCNEVIDTFQSFIEEGFTLAPEWATSESFGTLIRFSVSEDKTPLHYNKSLEQFVPLIERQKKFERKDIFKEKKIRFYSNNNLYIYKSNKLRDWTEFMAIKDANEEIHLLFQKLEGL